MVVQEEKDMTYQGVMVQTITILQAIQFHMRRVAMDIILYMMKQKILPAPLPLHYSMIIQAMVVREVVIMAKVVQVALVL